MPLCDLEKTHKSWYTDLYIYNKFGLRVTDMFYMALCDDSRADLDILTGYLAGLRDKYKLEDTTYQSGSELVELYKSGRRFHLVILDMVMEPMNGIETARGIRRYDADVPILIVTSTPEYAIDGYRVNASRYLLKPVEEEGFLDEVCRIIDRHNTNKSRYYSFSCESGIVKLELDSIVCFESELRTITVHTTGKSYTFTGKIKELEQQLQPLDFVRVHKSYIVNLRSIHRIFKDTVTMSQGSSFPLSKSKSHEVHQRLLGYMEKSI